MSNKFDVCQDCIWLMRPEHNNLCKSCERAESLINFEPFGTLPMKELFPSAFVQDKAKAKAKARFVAEIRAGFAAGAKAEAAPKSKPRVGETITSLANALGAVSKLLTKACEVHSGEWEGGRLKLSHEDCDRECVNSMMRHLLAEATGELVDAGEGGLGMYHDVAIAANALIRVECRIREEPWSWGGKAKPGSPSIIGEAVAVVKANIRAKEEAKATKEEQELYKKTDALAEQQQYSWGGEAKPKVKATEVYGDPDCPAKIKEWWQAR